MLPQPFPGLFSLFSCQFFIFTPNLICSLQTEKTPISDYVNCISLNIVEMTRGLMSQCEYFAVSTKKILEAKWTTLQLEMKKPIYNFFFLLLYHLFMTTCDVSICTPKWELNGMSPCSAIASRSPALFFICMRCAFNPRRWHFISIIPTAHINYIEKVVSASDSSSTPLSLIYLT